LPAAVRIDPDQLSLLRKAMRDKELHPAAIDALTKLGPLGRPALPELRDILGLAKLREGLKQPEPPEGDLGKHFAAEEWEPALGALIGVTGRASEARPLLRARLKSPDIHVRRETVKLLGELSSCDPDVLPLLIEALQDPDVITPLPLPPAGMFSNHFGAGGQ